MSHKSIYDDNMLVTVKGNLVYAIVIEILDEFQTVTNMNISLIYIDYILHQLIVK